MSGVNGISSTVDIAVSGLRAETVRMNVIANNIANAGTSRTPEGGPFRRQEALLSAGDEEALGVTIERIAPDLDTEFKKLFQPGHPDADDDGYVLMPNVDLPIEMINLVTASRAYQANAAVLKRYQDLVEATIELLR